MPGQPRHTPRYYERLERYVRSRINSYEMPGFSPAELNLTISNHREAGSRALEFLRLDMNCTAEQLSERKRSLNKEFHPDKCPIASALLMTQCVNGACNS